MSIDRLLQPRNDLGRFPDTRKLSAWSQEYRQHYSLVENWDGVKRFYDAKALEEIRATFYGEKNREVDYEWLEDLVRHNDLIGDGLGFDEEETLGVVVQHIHDHYRECVRLIAQMFKGKNMLHAFSAVYASMIFGRHCYIEGSSGTGKTALVRSLCNFLELPYQQFDAASDVTDFLLVGGEVPNSVPGHGMDFVFQRGPLINPGALTLVIDELPRLPASTSNVLLQAMSERKVTISLVASGRGSTTVLLSPGFAVIGMGNPVGYGGQGERSLALYDRFDIGIDMEHPDAAARLEIYDLATRSPEARPDSPAMRFTLGKAAAALPKIKFPKELKQLLALASYALSPQSFRDRVAWGSPLPANETIGRAINPLVKPIKRGGRKPDWQKEFESLQGMVSENLVEGSNPRGEISALINSQAHAAMHGRERVTLEDLKAGFKWSNFARLKTYPGCEAERRKIIDSVCQLCFDPETITKLGNSLTEHTKDPVQAQSIAVWFECIRENQGDPVDYDDFLRHAED